MDDRRTLPRLTPASPTRCRLLGPAPAAPVPAVLVDCTARGVGLYLPDRPNPDRRFELAAGAARPVAVRVVHVRPGPRGGFHVGAEFDPPLSAEQMQELLGGA
jgi:hypothetical protein